MLHIPTRPFVEPLAVSNLFNNLSDLASVGSSAFIAFGSPNGLSVRVSLKSKLFDVYLHENQTNLFIIDHHPNKINMFIKNIQVIQ